MVINIKQSCLLSLFYALRFWTVGIRHYITGCPVCPLLHCRKWLFLILFPPTSEFFLYTLLFSCCLFLITICNSSGFTFLATFLIRTISFLNLYFFLDALYCMKITNTERATKTHLDSTREKQIRNTWPNINSMCCLA